MAELVAADAPPPPSLLAPLTDPAGGSALTRIGAFAAQGPVRRALPWFGGMAGLGMMALAWATLAPQPQRTLYTELDDGERAKVASSLEKAGITYHIDNQTGALSVGEDDLYKAKMLVASDGALAAPDNGGAVSALPLGASRAVEGDHLRAAREHDLTLSIMEIDGVEAVRVHLAEAEKSVFVRDNVAPTASVMVRLARGRSMSDGQVAAIVNLVAGSVPGLGAMFTNGLYGIYGTIDALNRKMASSSDAYSLAASITRYTAQKTKVKADLSGLTDKQEALRVQLVSRFASTQNAVSASTSTLSFLKNQIDAWNSKN